MLRTERKLVTLHRKCSLSNGNTAIIVIFRTAASIIHSRSHERVSFSALAPKLKDSLGSALLRQISPFFEALRETRRAACLPPSLLQEDSRT